MSKPPAATQPRGRPRNPLEVWGSRGPSVPPGWERAGGMGEEEGVGAKQERKELGWQRRFPLYEL